MYWLEGILSGARAFGSGAENGLVSLTSPASLSEEGVAFCSYSTNSGRLFWTIVARGVRLPLPQREDRGLSLGLSRSVCLVGGRPGIVAGSVNVSFDNTDRHSAYENLTYILEQWSWSPRTDPSNPFFGVVTGHLFAWFPRLFPTTKVALVIPWNVEVVLGGELVQPPPCHFLYLPNLWIS